MCYSYDVSKNTFLIGTFLSIINLYVFRKNTIYVSLTLYWFWGGILMQLWETLLWKNYHCKFISNIAMINNLLQPVLLLIFLLISNYKKLQKKNLPLIISIAVFYLLLVSILINKSSGCVKFKEGILLEWWNVPSSILYLVTTLSLFYLLLDIRMALFQIFYFLGSLLTANILHGTNIKEMLFNPQPSRVASIWCWCAAFVPIYNYLLFKYIDLSK
tara:strand:+ start:3465 stop:4112 length:648 start_codon:yes stop_codon:yes gene_type:complete